MRRRLGDLSRWREACPTGWWTSSPPVTRTARLAHRVNGIGIIQPFSRGQAFGRADVVVDRKTRARRADPALRAAPICAQEDRSPGTAPAGAAAVPSTYEGRAVIPDPVIVQAMAPALQRVHELQATTLGVSLDRADSASRRPRIAARQPLRRSAARCGARRGRRGRQQRGARPLGGPSRRSDDLRTALRRVPFDNRIVRIVVSGRRARPAGWPAEIRQGRRGALGIAGVAARASCSADGIHVDLVRPSGRLIHDDDRLLAVTIGAPTLSGSLASAAPLGGIGPTENAPVVRELVEDWFRRLGHVAHAPARRCHPSQPGVRRRANRRLRRSRCLAIRVVQYETVSVRRFRLSWLSEPRSARNEPMTAKNTADECHRRSLQLARSAAELRESGLALIRRATALQRESEATLRRSVRMTQRARFEAR